MRFIALTALIAALATPAEAWLVQGGAPPPALFVNDAFAGTAGTAITAHTDILGNSYTYVGLSPDCVIGIISSGLAGCTVTAGTNQGGIAINSGTAPGDDYTVSANVLIDNNTVVSTDEMCIYAHLIAGTQLYGFCLNNGNFVLDSFYGGTDHVLQTTAIGSSITYGALNSFVLSVSGSSIVGKANGVTVVSGTTGSVLTGGKVAFFVLNDNFNNACSSATQNFCFESLQAQ